MRKTTKVAAALALIATSVGSASAQDTGARLQGTFAMSGTLTKVDHVYGEHRGQHVSRTWTFTPHCPSGSCPQVTLQRVRSGQQLLDVLTLTRQGPDRYAGRGHFWVALRCAGKVVPHGGRAFERITVRITATTVVGTETVATAISATYTNPKRVNLTRCPGGIGHDAANYQGQLVGPAA